jgi:hypothetical protein
MCSSSARDPVIGAGLDDVYEWRHELHGGLAQVDLDEEE